MAREAGMDLERAAGPALGVSPASVSCAVEVDVTAVLRSQPAGLMAAVVTSLLRALRMQSASGTVVASGALGVTVDAPGRPVVVALPRASDLNRTALARRIDEGADRARAGRLTADDLVGTTFTLVDAGARGVHTATPALAAGQVAALAVGAVVERPVVMRGVDGEASIAIRSMVHLVLAADPARLDDRRAAELLRTVKDGLDGTDDRRD